MIIVPHAGVTLGLPQFDPIEKWLQGQGFRKLPPDPRMNHGRIAHHSQFERGGTQLVLVLEGPVDSISGEVSIGLMPATGPRVWDSVIGWARWLRAPQPDPSALEEDARFVELHLEELESRVGSLDGQRVKLELAAPDASYVRLDKDARATIQAALESKEHGSRASPSDEAWVAYAMHKEQSLSLSWGSAAPGRSIETHLAPRTLFFWGDTINAALPTPEQVSGALWRIQQRGWLVVWDREVKVFDDPRTAIPKRPKGGPPREEFYSLTPAALASVGEILDGGRAAERIKRLARWMSDHPPPVEP